MALRPNPGDQIEIDQAVLTFCADPENPQQALSRFGSQSIVYQLADSKGGRHALKVFTFAFRLPAYELQPKAMAPYAGLEGMETCKRRVIVPADHPELVIYHPALRYAVLMPWVQGQTWEEISAGKLTLTSEQRLKAARALVEVLVELEQRGVAHANLNPSNVLFELPLTGPVKAHLVDMEGMYIPTLPKPDPVLVDDARYAHPAVDTGLWDPTVDRYAGGLLLAEILVSKNGDELSKVWGEEIGGLFERIMQSGSPEECPTLTEWQVAIGRAEQAIAPAPAAYRVPRQREASKELAARMAFTLTPSTISNTSEEGQPGADNPASEPQNKTGSTNNRGVIILGIVLLAYVLIVYGFNAVWFLPGPVATPAVSEGNYPENETVTPDITAMEPVDLTATEPVDLTATVQSYYDEINEVDPYQVQFSFGRGWVTRDCEASHESPSYSQEDVFYDEWFYLVWKYDADLAEVGATWSVSQISDRLVPIYEDIELNMDPNEDDCGRQGFSLEGTEPGDYYIEVRSGGDVLFRHHFEITWSDLAAIPRPERPPFGYISFGRDGWNLETCTVITETRQVTLSEIEDDEWFYFTSPFQLEEVGKTVYWKLQDADSSIIYKSEREIQDNVDLCFAQGFSMDGMQAGDYNLFISFDEKTTVIPFSIQ